MPAGRPPYFTDPKQLEQLADEYFLQCEQDSEPITLTGLALHLGFCDKCSIYDYEAKPEFSHSIKKARLRVENAYEKSLVEKGRSGDIFALKNFGWKDKQEVEQTGTSNVTVTLTEDGLKQAASKITNLMDSIRNDRKA